MVFDVKLPWVTAMWHPVETVKDLCNFIDLVKLSLGKVEFHYLIADFDCHFSFDLAEYTTYRRTVKRVKI